MFKNTNNSDIATFKELAETAEKAFTPLNRRGNGLSSSHKYQ